MLQHPDPNKPFVLEVDTSDIAVGAILSQRTGPRAKLKHCAFFSRRLSPAERNYCVGDRDLLAIKLALEEWRHLLEGAEHPFVIFTDHKNLIYLRTTKRLNARQARWSLFFDRFNFSLSFRPGHKNAKADALSPQFAPDTDQTVPPSVLPMACQVAFLALQDEPDPGTRPPGRWFIPSAARAPVITWACDSRFSCHPGTARTTAVIKRHFWWESLERDVQEYVAACGPCARSKTRTQRPSGLRQPLFIPSWPWSHIALDFVTRLPNSSGKTVVLSNINRFSKAAHFIALKKLPTAAENCQVDGRLRLQAPSYVRNIKCN